MPIDNGIYLGNTAGDPISAVVALAASTGDAELQLDTRRQHALKLSSSHSRRRAATAWLRYHSHRAPSSNAQLVRFSHLQRGRRASARPLSSRPGCRAGCTV
jgi:hypothetical protein